ncbi:MAG TPA: serine hydrolase [Chloroflexota bacterium]|nr:serine hydrolase [Chloroflexota bacterium]
MILVGLVLIGLMLVANFAVGSARTAARSDLRIDSVDVVPLEQSGAQVAMPVIPPAPSIGVIRPGTATTPRRYTVDPVFSAEIQSFLRHQKGTYGVAVAGLNSGVSALVNGNEQFATASLYKLFLMYEVMRQVEVGVLSLDDTVTTAANYTFIEGEGGIPADTEVTIDEALRTMIGASSNAGALALLDLVGPAALNNVPSRLGLQNTELAARPSGNEPGHYFVDGVTTATDLMTFFVALDAGHLVGPGGDARMQDILLGQRIRDRLPTLLPREARVAHKTGDLDHSVHDVGIVYLPRHRFVIVVLSRDVPYDDSKAVIAELSRSAHEWITR